MKTKFKMALLGGTVFAVAVLSFGYGKYSRLDVVHEIYGGSTQFQTGASYQLCFVPDGDSCQDLVVAAIDSTKAQLRVQAYSFTSKPIAEALKRAKERGVDVKVILDESQVSQKYSGATFLRNTGLDVVIDTKPAIAHNKVMVFDKSGVFTGSFNFTKAAQERNAENGLIIRGDYALTSAYLANWEQRYRVSSRY